MQSWTLVAWEPSMVVVLVAGFERRNRPPRNKIPSHLSSQDNVAAKTKYINCPCCSSSCHVSSKNATELTVMSPTEVSSEAASPHIHMMFAAEQDFLLLTRGLTALKPRLSQTVYDITKLVDKSRHLTFGNDSDLAAFTKCNEEALGYNYLLYVLSVSYIVDALACR